MGTYFIFTLKAAVCMIAFYLFYMLLMRKETFHHFNRAALLGIVVMSIVLPFINITSSSHSDVSQGMATIENFINSGTVVEQDENAPLTFIQIMFIIYLTGVVIFAILEIISMVKLFCLLRKGTTIKEDGRKVVVMDDDTAPFSWFDYIVISRNDYDNNRREILTHEKAHINMHHSLDIAFCNLLTIVQWFNPAAWLIKRELQNVHEYEADEAVLDEGVNAVEYQMLLIRKSAGERLFSMANNLNHNSLKKRITMMTIKKSNPWQRMKYLFVIPVAAIAVTAFASPKTEEVSQKVADESNSILPETYVLSNDKNTTKEEMKTTERNVKNDNLNSQKAKGSIKNTGRESHNEDNYNSTNATGDDDEDKVYDVIEQMPTFPKGQEALFNYVMHSIKYPAKAAKKGIQGRVIVSFIVGKDGSISNAEIARSVDPDLDAEALRVVSSMQKWNPGKQDGKPVRVKFTIPITFRLK